MSCRTHPLSIFRKLRRPYSSTPDAQRLEQWFRSPKSSVLSDTLHPERVADLLITLPTRDGTRKPYVEPLASQSLGFGHHLVFFHHRVPEASLQPDGTDGSFAPPPPFLRRMWAGGTMQWDGAVSLQIGRRATATSTVTSIQKKGFEQGKPMLFLNQRIEYQMQNENRPSLIEDRTHVYMHHSITRQTSKEVLVPSSYDFALTYTPSLTTLFRFSALTFNAHHIHLDKDYAQRVDGYAERLVHGPLTALMLLETVADAYPQRQIRKFTYRAHNPLVVGKAHTIHALGSDDIVDLWCADEDGIIGMTGKVELATT